jgi:hypothetical protein
MKKNMGPIDRAVRTILALVLAYLIFEGTIAGTLAVILGLVAILFLVTSAVSVCPGYIPFKFSTLKKNP